MNSGSEYKLRDFLPICIVLWIVMILAMWLT